MTSERALTVFAIIFFGVLILSVGENYLFGDVVVDVRISERGPEMLFRGTKSLWVPAPWTEYYWFSYKAYILAPFVVSGIGLGLWNRWEVKKADYEN